MDSTWNLGAKTDCFFGADVGTKENQYVIVGFLLIEKL